jgi:gamma-glutamylcyclotransferase (GGCT)/AIG2-like uncharacterized protein YtfP
MTINKSEKVSIFVYGTLKPGEDNYIPYCKDRYSQVFNAKVKGEIYDLPMGYPAMVESDEWARGVLYEFTDISVLYDIDSLEGYDPSLSEDQNLYKRKMVEVFGENKKFLCFAWAYYMNKERVIRLGGHKVNDGCWHSKTRFQPDCHHELIKKLRAI